MQTTRPAPTPTVLPVPPEPTPRSLSTWIWVGLGLALLTASFAGTRLLWTPSASADHTAPSQTPTEVAVCFGHVDVEYGVVAIAPEVGGRVVEVSVVEGPALIKKDTVLFKLDSTQAELSVREAEADLLAAEATLKQAEKLPEQHEAQLRGQQAAVGAADSELGRAQAFLSKVKRLHGINQASDEDLKGAQEQEKKAQDAKAAEEARLDELKLRLPRVGVDRARADVEAKKAQLERARDGLEKCKVKAPSDGIVLRRMVNVGDLLGLPPKQPSIMFCPNTPRIIRAEVEQEFASRVHEGQLATIQDDARASITWRGKVRSVSDWYSQRRSILLEPKQFNDVRTLECIVELDPDQPPLKIGQRVRVTLSKP